MFLPAAGCGDVKDPAATDAISVPNTATSTTSESTTTTATTEAPKRTTTTRGATTTTVTLPPTTAPHPVSPEVAKDQKARLAKAHFDVIAVEPDDAAGSSAVIWGEYDGDRTQCYYKANVTEVAGVKHDKIGITFTSADTHETRTFSEPPRSELRQFCAQQALDKQVVISFYGPAAARPH
jgi:hypothetical protein